jgi:hypothetical protein
MLRCMENKRIRGLGIQVLGRKSVIRCVIYIAWMEKRKKDREMGGGGNGQGPFRYLLKY